MNRGLLLDRDGVVNVDHDYVHTVDRFDWVPGIFDLARAACDRGYRIAVVTNQSGIGRGLYSQAQFDALTAWMAAEFARRGAPLAAVYCCPWHPEHGAPGTPLAPRDSFWRKPHPGMILQAARELDLDLGRSLLVGDKAGDIAAARAAGVGTTVFFASGRHAHEAPGGADHVAAAHGEILARL
ncbi:MAG TPA: HAD family hydrolase [Alphaproteobacteria bacterium]|nr:HAD family hydrolase [Alphaproteobacteria bacterium]